jgi:3-methyladenine DNA glycosylase AlkD
MIPAEQIEAITKLMYTHADAKKSIGMQAYMKNKFPFLGIQKPMRSTLQKTWIEQFKNQDIEIINAVLIRLWQLPEREFQYVGIDLMVACKKKWTIDSEQLFIEMATQKPWWDTVDYIAAKMLGVLWLKHHDTLHAKIITHALSEDIWLNRIAILHQLTYKAQTNTQLLEKVIACTTHKNEFFIQKAIGWALRQYSYTNPKYVKQYVQATPQLSKLSKREALKAINRKIKSE